MKLLILFPHGLGDCILATPAIRIYKQTTGNYIGIAVLERYRSAQLFAHNPYVDDVLFISCTEYEGTGNHERHQYQNAAELAKTLGYDRGTFMTSGRNGSKIRAFADCLDVGSCLYRESFHTEVYTTEEDKEFAHKFTRNSADFGFVHSTAGQECKSLPEGFGREWIRKHKSLATIVEAGISFAHEAFDINKQFEIMRLAGAVCLTDSVFYHACGAMNKDVDFVYFQKGKGVYDSVRPLHCVNQNVAFRLDNSA